MKRPVRIVTSLLALGCALTLAQPAAARAEDHRRVTPLGTGSPRPSPERTGPSTLVEVGGQDGMRFFVGDDGVAQRP